MSEKIYARLLRLYPSHFRKQYEAEALQLIRDRLRDERGFYKRARLWWDLLTDILVALPSAHQNSYAVTESASLSLNASSIPSFKILDEAPLERGSILVGGTISLILLAAFALLLSRQIAFRPVLGPNGRLSPIEAVMQHLNQPPVPDSPPQSSRHYRALLIANERTAGTANYPGRVNSKYSSVHHRKPQFQTTDKIKYLPHECRRVTSKQLSTLMGNKLPIA